MKAYITKYALTSGCFETEVENGTSNPSFCYTKDRWRSQFRWDIDAFRSIAGAEADARDRAARKLKSLEKSRVKVAGLVVTPKWAKK